MDQISNKKKIIIIITITVVVLSIVGLSIYGLVGGNTVNDTNSAQDDSSTPQNSQTIQQDVADMNTSVQKESVDYQAVKDAYADKARIKLAE
ncbi:MAG: hypothetical protein EOO17_04930 [Chloroflexi bacterium]|nr:MAG: hypothetical protein EOO17_04930 [Chloroflexota bacterium]